MTDETRKSRSKRNPEPQAEPQQQTDIQPGEGVEIKMGRLESGEWYAQIGAGDDEGAIAQTSAFPWDVLRGLAKQVKQLDGALGSFRILGEQECGRCEHATPDGRMCVALECPTGGAEAVANALKQGHALLGDGILPVPLDEIVRLHGTLKEPVLRGKAEDEDLLTATFEVVGEDLTPEYRYLKPSAKKQVVAIVYHAYAPAKAADVVPGQMSMNLDGSSETAATVEVLGCPVCLRIVRTEGAEPRMVCPLCENGALEFVHVPRLNCLECEAEPDHINAADGDECAACGKGKYRLPGVYFADEDASAAGGAEQQAEGREEEAA